MAESSVNNIDGVPFWGHGTAENLAADITPNKEQDETEKVDEETTEEDATPDDADEEESETEPSSE